MDTNCSFGWQYFTGSQGQGGEDGGRPRRQIGDMDYLSTNNYQYYASTTYLCL